MAQSSCAREWQRYSMPEVPIRQTRVKKTVIKVNHKRKLYIKCACLGFGYAMLLVTLCIKSATLGYQIEKLEADIQNLETANHRLDYQIAAKTSLNRVEWFASSQLGMYKPISSEKAASLAMEVKSQPITVASNSGSQPVTSLSQKLINTMYSSWSRLAQNN